MAVPNLPGVPPLSSYASGDGLLATALMIADGIGIYSIAFPAQWGIFLGGAPVVVADTVASFNYKSEWAIADYPVEKGAFATYDKVKIPFDARFRFSSGGSEANRQALLSSIQAVAADQTTLYDVVTPEEIYNSVTVSHVDYSRTAVNGVGLIQVDVWVLNVIVEPTSPAGQNTQSPSGASQVNGGTVQPSSAPTFDNGSTQPVPSLANSGF